MNRSKASGVSWVKPAEPSFLKKFKNDIGYKEGANVDTKVRGVHFWPHESLQRTARLSLPPGLAFYGFFSQSAG